MILKKSSATILILAFGILCAAGAAAAAPQGRWSGTVASVAGDDLALVGVAQRFRLSGRVTELLSGRALSPADIAPGSAVTLRLGPREADGRFRVDAAVVQPKDPLALEGAVTGIGRDGRSISVLGVRVELGSHTAYSGRGRVGLVRSAADLSVGMTAQVSLTATKAGALEASQVRVMSSRGRSARTVDVRTDEPGEDQEIRGTVLVVSDSAWTIDDRSFQVGAATVFLGNPGLGDFVEVRFHLDGGNAVADRIQKEDAANDELEFRGIVEAISDAAWTISGRVVNVNASTIVRGDPRVGDLVEVRADRAPDGTLTATDIHSEDDENADDEREFRGAVESIGASSWTVAGRIVLVNAQTVIFGSPRVGDLVEVRADRAADGTLTATRIKTEDEDDVDDEREFRGIVSAIGESSWTIGELVVLVNGATEIDGNPEIGDLVEVRADRAPDGTLTATRIHKEDSGGGDDDGDDDHGGPGGG
ncbi:MAG: DUF5666 domain-containing protein [Thermoanaerobaculia bacterium]